MGWHHWIARLLHLAATHACEAALAVHLETVLASGGLPDVETARIAVAPPPSVLPAILVRQPDLSIYDSLYQHQESTDVRS